MVIDVIVLFFSHLLVFGIGFLFGWLWDGGKGR